MHCFSLQAVLYRLLHQCPQKKIKSLYSSGKRQLKQLSQSGMLVGDQGDRFRGTRKADG